MPRAVNEDIFDNSQALAALVARLEPRLRTVIRRYERDPDAAADLLQECWVRAWERRAQFAGPNSIDGWIFAICARGCQMHVRRTVARPAAPLADTIAAPNVDDVGLWRLSSDQADAVWDAIAALPPRQLVIVVDRLLLQKPAAVVAQRLGISTGTVTATLSQARAKLRRALAGVYAATK